VFSKKRLALPREFSCIAIFDIANYYDNINHHTLRNVLSSIFLCDEVILDFLLMLLEGLSWRPDYLPPGGRGLPQVNFDAARLLAYAFLFEVDEYLRNETHDRFLRWVDDITIPADSTSEAAALLHGVDELLMTRGLRLNSGKTVILEAEQTERFLQRDENMYLNVLQGRVRRHKDEGWDLQDDRTRIRQRYRKFTEQSRIGHWDKVLKRYFTIFGELNDDYLECEFVDVMLNMPDIRSWALRYYAKLGPSRKRFLQIQAFLIDEHIMDDASIFEAAEVLVTWRLSPRGRLAQEVCELARSFGRDRFRSRSDMFLVAGLWLLAKYGTEKALQAHILLSKNAWSVSAYLARQVAAATARLSKASVIEEIRKDLFEFGQLDAIGVLSNLESLARQKEVPREMEAYLRVPRRDNKPYPLPKFLILMRMMRSRQLGPAAVAPPP
jgi:hypothetical protein